jgi:hypothetical protein
VDLFHLNGAVISRHISAEVLLKHSPVVPPPVSQPHESHIEIPPHAGAYRISKMCHWERLKISQFNHGNDWAVRIYVRPFFKQFKGSFNGVDNNDVLAQSACMHKVTFIIQKIAIQPRF